MKRLFSVLLSILVFSFAALAQQSDEAPKMSVRSFVLAENDNTANLHGTTVLDQNGDPCALIRVQTTQTGFAWDFGQMAACKTEYKTGEIWLYVPYGVKRVTVRHAQLGTMTYEFPIPVAKARTYVMDLVAANVVVLVEQEITQQYVVFKVTPPDAIVELDGQMLETRNGVARKKVKFGKYPYSVTARDYHSASGEVEVKDVESATTVEVSLVPAFGTLSFENASSLSGAVVFIDNDQVGTIPFGQEIRVPSGKHILKLNKPRYKAYTSSFEISDGQNLSLSPHLAPNFTEVSITTMEGAEIFANDVRLGKAPWKGELLYDSYSFEVRMPSHRSMYKSVDFFDGAPAEITLPAPIPIYGSIDVDCDQTAQVSIDGVPAGEAPCVISKVLVGEHVVTLAAKGFVSATRTVTVQEGKEEKLSITLVKGNQPPREQQSATTASPAAAPVAPVPASPAPAPKLKNNLFKVGGGVMKFADKVSDIDRELTGGVLQAYSLNAAYKHYFIKRNLGFSLGADVTYAFRNGFHGNDYHDVALSVPLDLVLKFGNPSSGHVLLNAGAFLGGHVLAVGVNREANFKANLATEVFFAGYQAGILYEHGGFAVGYNYAGNITGIPYSHCGMAAHMLSVGILF